MNLKVVIAIGRIYSLSFLRRRQTRQQAIGQLIRRPLIILLFDLSAFILSIFLGYIVDKFLLVEEELSVIAEMIDEMLIFVPALLIALPLAYGILFEFSQAAQTFTTEAINMLPIRADEYVLGSALSTIFILSPIPSIVLGLTCGLVGIGKGLYFLWLSILALSILALSGGSFIIEIIRAITNRVSSAFYSRGGRSALYIRFILSVIIFLVAMLLFNFNFLFLLLEAYSVEIISAWYIPILWPSIAILNLIKGDILLAGIYGALFFVFCLTCFFVSVELRGKYWAPQPVSIKISKELLYQPRKGLLQRIGYAPTEVALIHKDLRGLVRRKEMIRIVVAPLFSTVIMIITLLVTPQTEEMPTGLFNLFFLMGPILFGWLLGITSFGQEGESIPIIYSLPIKAKELVKAKVSSSSFIALISLIATLCFIYIVLPAPIDFTLFFTLLSFLLTIEATLIGVAVGAKYPDFTTTPRSRFITVTGSMVGIFVLGICLLIISLPFLLFYTIEAEFITFLVALGSLIPVGLIVCYFTYKIAIKNTKKLLESAQIM